MNRSAEPALRSLLPTHNGPFPPQLADLAGSLLAQSRHRASTLKADEEIARSYACAHIACDRLKTSLNLPPIEPRPPIQPRLYKRLYAHLNAILQPAPSARPSAFPPWVRPTVRYICHELGHPQLAPTIVAGLSAIHTEVAIQAKEKRKPPRNGDEEEEEEEENLQEWLNDSLTALVAALYLYCMSSWRENAAEGEGISTGAVNSGVQERQFQQDEKAILSVFEKVRGVVGARDDTDWDRWEDLQKRTFRDALVVVSKQQWLQSDWYGDIAILQPSTAGDGDAQQPDSNDEEEDEGDDGEYNGVSIPTKAWPADSMFQARWDFLSESKQQEYEIWRAQMLDRIERAQAVYQLPVAMDIV
ncbi:hypothetical protein SEPCBS119000_000897 [Sporothrix epigloea]|uniref:ORC6 first cyclin-like domain-containing protein n=1 Tax=Sporothrix epigloea TaxID=1892477 RepID=A0ABP0D7T6_9PEZI